MIDTRKFLAAALPATAVLGVAGYGISKAVNKPAYVVNRGVYKSEAECKAAVPKDLHNQCEPVSNSRANGHPYFGRWYGPAYYGSRSPWSGTSTIDQVGTTTKKMADGTHVSEGSYSKGSKSGGSKSSKSSGFGSTGKSSSGSING